MTAKVAAGRIAGVVVALVLTHNPAAAGHYMGTPSNYLGLLSKLRAGDTLKLVPGDYTSGLPVHGMVGLPGKPIVIRGPRSKGRARFVARPHAHTISIANSAWVEIHDLDLDGNGQPVAGVRAEGHSEWAHHITLDGLRITGHGTDQSIVGIAVFCPAWGWVIRNNTIIGAGTGMYLGASDGGAPFIGGLIEHNLVVDTIGYNVQIKHQRPRPHIDGMPDGNNTTIIRHNAFAKSANSSRANLARPNLLVGHWPISGPGSEDRYVIYGNFFYGNPTEALFQGEGNIAFYNNALVNMEGDAINIQPHNDVPKRIAIFHNTVLAAGSGIRVTGGHPDYPQRVIANAVFAGAPLTGGEQRENVAGLLEEAADYLVRPFAPAGSFVLARRPGKLLVQAHDVDVPRDLPDVNRDFDGRMRSVPVAGAYTGSHAMRQLRIAPKQRR